jgi:hypothetical protein
MPAAGRGTPAAGRGSPAAAGGWPEAKTMVVMLGGVFFLEVFRFFSFFRDI